MRVLVCGGRNFDDALTLGSWLGGIHKKQGITLLIEGGARGADHMARRFAEWAGIPVKTFNADWEKHGRAAGPIRNKQMLEEGKPDLVVAFDGGRGTADMMRQARAAGVEVLVATKIVAN
jgi:predicted Rossmann-fold nucleotide-binding protein